jgi:hypothetical protein
VFTFLTVRFYMVGPSTPEWPLVCWRYGASWCSSWRERRPRSRPWLITPLDHHIPVPEPKRRHLALPFVRRRQGHAEQREVLAVLDPGKPQTRHGGVTAGIHQSLTGQCRSTKRTSAARGGRGRGGTRSRRGRKSLGRPGRSQSVRVGPGRAHVAAGKPPSPAGRFSLRGHRMFCAHAAGCRTGARDRCCCADSAPLGRASGAGACSVLGEIPFPAAGA